MARPTRHSRTGIYRVRVAIPMKLRDTMARLFGARYELTENLGTRDSKEAISAGPAPLVRLKAKLKAAQAAFDSQADRVYSVTPNPKSRIRVGLRKCGECRDTFGSRRNRDGAVAHPIAQVADRLLYDVREQDPDRGAPAPAPARTWILSLGGVPVPPHLVCSQGRGSHQDKLTSEVEDDETYVGDKVRGKGQGYVKNKTTVVSPVEKGSRVRSTVFESVNQKVRCALLNQHIDASAHLNTNESTLYIKPGKGFASHKTVNHSKKQYARRDADTGRVATTNGVEGLFGNSKQSIDGTHH